MDGYCTKEMNKGDDAIVENQMWEMEGKKVGGNWVV